MDFKSQLNQHCQQTKLPSPRYEVAPPEGQSHEPTFPYCKVFIGDTSITVHGEFYSKREAEKHAAQIMLKRIQETQVSKEEKVDNSNTIYIIDFDNSSGDKGKIPKLNCEVHLFCAASTNLDKVPTAPNIQIHVADRLIPEYADHMITWYCARNLERLQKYKIIIISKDKGLYAVSEILKLNKVYCEFRAFL